MAGDKSDLLDGVEPAAAAAGGLAGLAGVARDAEAERVLASLRSRLFAREAPAKLGRFLVIERLGAGATGVVYAAYDPALDRKVAIKVLRFIGPMREEHRARLVREAKAMARLNHPNVVAVHELGSSGGDEVFVVMELVEGTTLSAWLQERPSRSWRERLEVMLEAGRGLAAAHVAGIIHRDFKPDNVLIAQDGSVRVADFGLAQSRAIDPSAQEDALGDEPAREASSQDERAAPDDSLRNEPGPLVLTRSGVLVGTPAYMAPEVLAGEPADALSDQFSFCVTLYEALCGQRPYSGDSMEELRQAVDTAQLRPPRSGSMPGWLRRLLLRGLATDRADRFASMAALLNAIASRRTRSRRRLLAAAGVLGVALLGAWSLRAQPPPPAPTCSGAPDLLQQSWGEPQRAQLQQVFSAHDRPYAADSFTRTARALDRYGAEWVSAHREACLATHERGEQSQASLEIRMRCLARRRNEMGSLVSVLAQAKGAAVVRAVRAAAELTPVAVCADVEALRRAGKAPDDPRTAAEIETLRIALAAAEQQGSIGRFKEGGAAAETVLKEAESLKYEPFIADVRVALGHLQLRNGSYQEARESLRQAFSEGLASGNDRAATAAAIRATALVGFRLHKPEDGHRWAWLGRTMLTRLGDDPALEAALMSNHGNVYFAQQDFEQAAAQFEQAITLYARAHGPEHIFVGFTRMNLGAVRRKQQRLDAAREQLELAEAIVRKQLGEQHPDLGRVLNALGNLHWARRDYERAEQYQRRALKLKETALEAGHPSIAHSCNNLADVLVERQQYEQARAMYQRALSTWQRVHGDTHRLVALARRGMAHTWLEQGEHPKARELLEQVLVTQQAQHIAGREQALTRFWLARSLWPQASEHPRAIELAQASLRMLKEAQDKRSRPRVEAWLQQHAPAQP